MNYEISLEYIDRTLKYINNHVEFKCNNDFMVSLYTLMSFCHAKIGNSDLSIHFGSKALKILNFSTFYFTQNKNIHNTMSISYLKIGEYTKALDQAIVALNNSGLSDPNKILQYNSLTANLYSIQNNFNYAKKYFDKCHRVITNEHNIIDFYKNYYYRDISEYFLKTNNPDSAHYYLKKIQKALPSHVDKLNFLQNMAEFHSLKKEQILAQEYINKAIQFSLDSLSHDKFKINETLLFSSRIYQKSNDHQEANRNILQLFNNLNYSKENHANIKHIRLVIEALILYSNNLILTNKHKEAKQIIVETSDLINYFVINKLTSFESKLIIIDKFREACLLLLDYFIKKGEADFIFEIINRFHGNLVLNELFMDEAAYKFNIPDEYIDYEESLKARISQREHTLLQLDHDNIKYDSLQQDLNYYRGELENVIKSIEQANPAYHKLKYSSPPAKSVKHIKKNILNKKSALIEYFLGKDNLYTFIITKDGLEVVSTEIDSILNKHIYNLNSHIRSLTSEVTFDSYVESSEYLYNVLLKDVKSKLDPKVNQLYIIPDNEINYIPFSALFEKAPEDSREHRYDLLPYFGKEYDISYHYSSSLLDYDGKVLNSDLSGFAPSFTSDYSNSEKLDQLLYNQDEVLLIKDITDGHINIDSAATLPNLRQSFNDYRIAHLATHATCNDSLPFESKIHLEDGALHAYEIYNMPHNLDLAVLSACQTGDGALKKGEGIMSLARAFISSGCKSVITSLWNVNDQNSAVLMKSFYQHLWDGKTIGQSLASAKREYLENTNSVLQAHPYHWATFIAIGNSDMAISRTPWGDISLLILLVIVAAILFVWFYRTRRYVD